MELVHVFMLPGGTHTVTIISSSCSSSSSSSSSSSKLVVSELCVSYMSHSCIVIAGCCRCLLHQCAAYSLPSFTVSALINKMLISAVAHWYGMCRAKFVSPEQLVWCIPVRPTDKKVLTYWMMFFVHSTHSFVHPLCRGNLFLASLQQLAPSATSRNIPHSKM